MITIEGSVLGPNDQNPDAGSYIQFTLSGPMMSSAGVAVTRFTQTAQLNPSDGTFSLSLEPTTTALPNSRFYDISVNARFGGVPASYRVGRCRVRSSPTPQRLEIIGLGDEPDTLHISREVPFGIVDGFNDEFSIRYVPQDGSELLFIDELLQSGNSYQLINNQLQILTPPTVGQRIKLFYLNSAFDAPGHISRETPDGVVDGSNAVFTLRNTPASGLEMGFVNEQYQIPGVAYTISGNTITFNSGSQPPLGSRILLWYPLTTLYPIHRRDQFTGDGSTTNFALTGAILNTSELVFNGSLYQERNIPAYYTVSADQKTIMFATPVPNGQKATVYYQEGD